MIQPSSQKQAGHNFNRLQIHQHSLGWIGLQKWSLKTKVILWALAISVIPVLTVGAGTYYLESQLVTKQISQIKPVGATDLAETDLAQQKQLLFLIITLMMSVLAGAIATLLANRALRPVLNAAALSTTIVNSLRREIQGTSVPVESIDERVVLETNISFIKEQLPKLLGKVEQAYQAAETAYNEQRQQKEALQRQVSELLTSSEIVVQTLSEEVAFNQTESATSIYDQIQTLGDSAENIVSLLQQLDSDIAQIKPLVHEVIDALKAESQQAISGTELVEKTQQKLEQIVTVNDRMKTLVIALTQTAAVQVETSTKANQSILGIVSIANHTSEQAFAVAESFVKLATFVQDLQEVS
ncbi:MAG: hypothetical protein DSM106950_25870 [Stigonema ocellatum SAG 48.90 = DSM 106950]|nr:hypothetical protein [Stigonema ocellatum SAG 48.90 = DSM 106950]